MPARPTTKATAWSHEGLERRGYRKCPFCWRHLVKIEAHVAAHEAGLIGPDGKRRDRTPAERQRWAQRYNGRAASGPQATDRAVFVRRRDYERILRLRPVDLAAFRRQIDAATDQEP